MLVTTRILAALNESITWNRQSSLTEYTRSTLWNSTESVWVSERAVKERVGSPAHGHFTATHGETSDNTPNRWSSPTWGAQHEDLSRFLPVRIQFFLKTSTLQALPCGVSGNIGRIWKWRCVLEGRGWSFPVGMGISKYTVLFSKRQWDIKKL